MLILKLHGTHYIEHVFGGRRDMPPKQQCCITIEAKVQLSEVENRIDRLLEGEAICSINIHLGWMTCILVSFAIDLLIWILS